MASVTTLSTSIPTRSTNCAETELCIKRSTTLSCTSTTYVFANRVCVCVWGGGGGVRACVCVCLCVNVCCLTRASCRRAETYEGIGWKSQCPFVCQYSTLKCFGIFSPKHFEPECSSSVVAVCVCSYRNEFFSKSIYDVQHFAFRLHQRQEKAFSGLWWSCKM